MKKIVIFGTGSIGQMAHFYFTHDSDFKIAAFTADAKFVDSDELLDLPVVKFEDVEKRYPPSEYDMFIALSYANINRTRAEKYALAKKMGYKLVSYVCSKLVTWGETEIGDNVFIFENQTIQPYVKIGNDVIMWSGNHIGHHTQIGNHCFISSHVVMASNCKVGDYSFLGINSTLRNGITIAPECVIGAGSVIVKDTVEKGVYIGAAARLYHLDSSQIKGI